MSRDPESVGFRPGLRASGLDELDQDAPGALGVEERHPVAPGARSRSLVDRAEALPPEVREGLLDIRYPEGHVVESRTATFEEAPDRRVRTAGLEEFDGADEGDIDSLAFELLDRGTAVAREEFEERPAVRDGRDGHGHVIERIGIHTVWGVRLGFRTPWARPAASAASYRESRDITRRMI